VDTLSEKAGNLQIHRKVLEFYSTASTLSWDYSNKIAISNDLTKWIKEEKQTVETLRRIPIDAYWKEHSEERIALETEKQAALTEIQALQGQIESLDEYTVHKSIENELNEVEGQLSNAGVTGIFKHMGSSAKEKGFKSILGLKDTVSSQMSEKKELKSKKAEVETRLQEAKARLDEAAKNFTDRIAELKQRIDQIEEEFNKDR
jgi:DNA repair ATPase RecN